MDKKILEKYMEAGRLSAEVRDYGASLVRPGTKLLDLAEAIDRKIAELKAEPAFPVNISINEIAAHYSPTLQDQTVIKAEDYVKVDIGIQVDGYIGDTAITVRPAGKDKLIECSEKMLETALKMFTPGTKMKDIGEAIENVAKRHGFNPIRNLSGHGLEQYDLHARSTVPNIKTNDDYVLKEGEVWAVEPFCTAGDGMVKESEPAMIFMFVQDKPGRTPESRKILELAKNRWHTLPFAKRWLQKELGSIKVEMALRQLIAANAIHVFDPLKEVSGKPVAQSEHTVIVAKEPIVTTR